MVIIAVIEYAAYMDSRLSRHRVRRARRRRKKRREKGRIREGIGRGINEKIRGGIRIEKGVRMKVRGSGMEMVVLRR